MKTEKEQTKAMIKILLEASKKCFDTDCNYCDDQYEKDCAQYRKAMALVQAGYGDVSEYKAERKMLGSKIKVLEQRLNDKYIEVDNLNRDYSNSFERLKAQGREITRLKAEVKQSQIDVLNNVKDVLANQKHECLERNNLVGYSAICVCEKFIDELIKEIQNGEDKG